MNRWLVVAILLAVPTVVQAKPTENNNEMKQNANGNSNLNTSKPQLDLPPGTKLIGTSQAAEMRDFVELQNGNQNVKNARFEDFAGAAASDTVYQTGKSYKDAVQFFDQEFRGNQWKSAENTRSAAQTATGWIVKLADGSPENVIVRNTQPTTIEVLQGAAVTDQMRKPQSDRNKK